MTKICLVEDASVCWLSIPSHVKGKGLVMLAFFGNVLSSRQFIPHGHCYLWQTELVTLHVVSDLLIAIAYYSIPGMLIYFVSKRRDIPFSGIFLLFGAFIISCGTTHLMAIWTLWHPYYWLSGFLKAITAAVSAYTAVQLISLLPKALALPSPAQLEAANARLETELKERLRIEARLQESEQFLRSIYDGVANAIFVVDVEVDGTFRFAGANPASVRLTGISSDELSGKAIAQVLPEAVKQEVRQRYESCVKLGKSISYEESLPFKEKDTWWLTTLTPLRDSNSRIYRLIGTATDINERKQVEAARQKLNEELEIRVQHRTVELRETNQQLLALVLERHQAEEALRESEAKYRSVVNNVKEVIFQVDTIGLWTFLNPAWTEITGFTVEESIGTNFLNYVYPNDRQRNLEMFQSLIEGKKNDCHHEIRYITVNGGCRWIEVYARSMLADDKRIIGTSGTLSDITKRKQAEAEILNALAKEKELSELKSHFVSMTSHEFRTPLTTILSASELLEYYSYKWTEQEKIEQLHLIQTAVKEMTQLLDDILLIGRAEAGKIEFNPAPIDLNKFCQDLVAQFQVGTGTVCAIAWNSQCDCIDACIDEKLLRQILNNLLSNAIKYSPEGGLVQFTLSCKDGKAVFEIRDEGIGIPLEDQQHLFESFHRATNVSGIPGNGLGLAIVKKCVDLHGGQIGVFSEIGLGTVFRVSVPIESAE